MTLANAAGRLLGGVRCTGCGRPGIAWCPPCAHRLPCPAPAVPVPGTARVLAAWPYEGAPRALILDLKVRGVRPAAAPLVDAMARAAARAGLAATVVGWVPGRRGDVRRRGFDHAAVLAHGVARRLGLPARPVLARVSGALDQAGLGASARRANARGAFAARIDLAGASVVVVDDLVTTGATLAACARALADAGAERVEGLVACRA